MKTKGTINPETWPKAVEVGLKQILKYYENIAGTDAERWDEVIVEIMASETSILCDHCVYDSTSEFCPPCKHCHNFHRFSLNAYSLQ